MPEISGFFGIVIAMYCSDHAPPHFHARYGSQAARISIDDLGMIDGDLSPRIRGIVIEWAAKHREELKLDWQRSAAMEPLFAIPPLE